MRVALCVSVCEWVSVRSWGVWICVSLGLARLCVSGSRLVPGGRVSGSPCGSVSGSGSLS